MASIAKMVCETYKNTLLNRQGAKKYGAELSLVQTVKGLQKVV